jgi:hypothetical protein
VPQRARREPEIRRGLGPWWRSRHGCAFSGEVSEESGKAAPVPGPFRILRGEEEIALRPGELILGRDPKASVRIDDSSVSRRHALLRVGPEAATIEDLGSKNGTFVNGRKVGSRPTSLGDGDELQLGSLFMTFRVVTSGKSTRTVRARRKR